MTTVDAVDGVVTDRFEGARVPVDAAVAARLAAACDQVSVDDAEVVDAGRDWWPLAIGWAARGQVPARPALVARPTDAGQVAAVLSICNQAQVPVTTAGGRSGVCGAAVPLFGGVVLDMCGIAGIIDIDTTSLVCDLAAGTFGPDVEDGLRGGSGLTLGHWPQSMDLSTVGGWLACRGAGQYSNRYGKIEDMVVGLEAVLADGTVVRTGGTAPRAATGPDLTQLFVGSEGTLGVITSARLRVRPVPAGGGRRAFGFATFDDGLEACRLLLRRGLAPAVLRLYDETESARNFEQRGTNVLIVLDEADPLDVAATMAAVDAECASATRLDDGLVDRWLDHRNDVSALVPLWRHGIVVDTVEVAARWAALPGLVAAVGAALAAIPGTLVASVHQSHAYIDGACLYFTFAARSPAVEGASWVAMGPDPDPLDDATMAWAERYYVAAWDAVTEATRAAGGAISHHHGIGVNRARFLPDALGSAFGVLTAVKRALDPNGILNPGKLGLPHPFGPDPWP